MQKSDWKKCKLGDVCYPVSETYDFSNREKVVFINTGDISFGKFLKKEYEPVVSLPGQAKKSIQKNDILFSEIRPANGRFALVDFDAHDFVVSTKLMVLRAHPIIDLKFLYLLLTNKYTLAEFQHIAESRSGTFPQITFDAISYFPIDLPPLDEQKRIAQILGSLDDKIELLQKQNKTLEDMAKAIFKSWFVDFDVVHAKQKGLPKADIMREYHLTDELYDLFPSDFENSSLGPIPSGWHVKTLSNIATLTMGQSPAGTTYNDSGEGLPFYQGRTDFEFRFPKKRVYCSAPTRIAEKGDVLISVRAPVGDLNMANERCCIGRGVASIRPNTPNNSFLYYAMLNIQKKFDVFNTEGTVFGSINRKDLSSLAILTPSEDVLREFNAIVTSFDLKIEENLKQIQTLTELRDTLLPPLISGKIRV